MRACGKVSANLPPAVLGFLVLVQESAGCFCGIAVAINESPSRNELLDASAFSPDERHIGRDLIIQEVDQGGDWHEEQRAIFAPDA